MKKSSPIYRPSKKILKYYRVKHFLLHLQTTEMKLTRKERLLLNREANDGEKGGKKPRTETSVSALSSQVIHVQTEIATLVRTVKQTLI